MTDKKMFASKNENIRLILSCKIYVLKLYIVIDLSK